MRVLSHLLISVRRYLYDVLRKVLRAPIFLDSSNLADLRTLFTDGIHQSDTVLRAPYS